MRAATELKNFVREARAMLARERDLAEFEIYCASAEHRVARIAYTSDIPSRGVEELKSARRRRLHAKSCDAPRRARGRNRDRGR